MTLLLRLASLVADFPSSFVTLFGKTDTSVHNVTTANFIAISNVIHDPPLRIFSELMVVNNWIVICDGMTAVTSEYARLYFVAFHVVGGERRGESEE